MKPLQAGINALGGYAAGRMEGAGRKRGTKERAADMQEYRDSLGAHLDYVGKYAEHQKGLAEYGEGLRQRGAEHATTLAQKLQESAHNLGLIAANHRAGLDTAFADQAHRHGLESGVQTHLLGQEAANAESGRRQSEQDAAHRNALEAATHNGNVNLNQMRAAADLAPQLRDTGVTGFSHNGTSMTITPQQAAPKPSGPNIPETWDGMTHNQLTAFDQHRGAMSPQQKAAHTKAKNALRPRS